MSARKRLVPDSEVKRIYKLAAELGCEIAGLDVGLDYVRTVPPREGGDSLAQYIGPAHRSQESEVR